MKYTRTHVKLLEKALDPLEQEPKLHGDKQKSEQSSFGSFLSMLWKPVDDFLWKRKVKNMKRR